MADPVNRNGSGPEGSPPSIALAAIAVYGLFVGAGYLWLYFRDRTDQIGANAVGRYGIWVSAGIGVGVAVAITGLFWGLESYLRPFARLKARLTALIGPLTDHEITVLAFCSALGEEFFFRLAMLDALGLVWSSVIFGLLHIGPRGLWLWTIAALALGLAFGWMMESGCGLLSVTVAHALVNYMSLRRMERR